MTKFNHGIGKDLRETVVIDIDGVLVDFRKCSVKCPGYDGYPQNHHELKREDCPVMKDAAKAFMEMKSLGLKIILHTGRDEVERERTEQWLYKHNIPYDELRMDKPRGFLYIDDLGHRFDNWEETMSVIKQSMRHIQELIK